jgi:hypothetical protein
MADEQATIKLETRLWALELLTCNLLATIAALNDANPDELIARTRDQTISGARRLAFAGVDPAMSDHLSGELESALARLIDMASFETSRRWDDF